MALGTYDRLVERMALGTYDRLVELAGCTL